VDLEKPLNTQEKYLYAMVMRLDAISHMLSSFMEVYAKQADVATTQNTVKEEPQEKPKTKKNTKKK